MTRSGKRGFPLSSAPSYAPVIDDEHYLTTSRIIAARESEHQRLFPEQYENGVRVRDRDGNLIPKKRAKRAKKKEQNH